MLKEQAVLARRILNNYRRGKFDNYLQTIRQEERDDPKPAALLQTYLNHYHQRYDWSDLDKDIQAFVNSLIPGYPGVRGAVDINRLISRCIRIQSKFTRYSSVTGFTRNFVDIEVHGRDKEYVYNIAPIRLVPKASIETPCENIFFLEEHGGKMACRIDDDIIVSGHCMWRKLERIRDENVTRLVFVEQYVKP